MKTCIVLLILLSTVLSCAKNSSGDLPDIQTSSSSIKTIDFSNNAAGSGEVILDYSSEVSGRGFVICDDICLGSIEITGENSQVNIAALIQEMLTDGKIKLKLPAGDHTVKIKIKIKRATGVIENYIATFSVKIIANQQNIIVMVKFDLESVENPSSSSTSSVSSSSASSGGTVVITTQFYSPIYVTLIHRTQGWLVLNALFTLKTGNSVLLSRTLPDNFYEVQLPVQAEKLTDITAPYTFEIAHPDYRTLTGTIKVALDGMEINGVVMRYFYQYQNFNHYMDPK